MAPLSTMLITDYFFECDGPPRAYFELISLVPQCPSNPFRCVYEAVYINGWSEDQVREKFDQLLLVAYQPTKLPPDRERRNQLLVWRHRPEVTIEGKRVTLYARLWISNFTFSYFVEKNEADQYVWDLTSP